MYGKLNRANRRRRPPGGTKLRGIESMDKARRLRTAWCVLALIGCIWSQETLSQDTKTEPKAAASAPEILPKLTEVHAGDKVKLTAVTKDASGQQQNAGSATWFAAPGDTVAVDDTGLVSFYSAGRATVGVVVNGKPTIVHINVLPLDVARIEIDPPGNPVVVGGVIKLLATPRTEKGDPRSDKAVEWTSKNPSLATVDDAGVVTGIAPGSAE